MLKKLLRPLGELYLLGQRLDQKLKASKALPVPVISVGNIASGGRGKTPLVIHLCRGLKARGFYPIVLTRGYGRQGREPVWLEKSPELSWPRVEDTGDEALEIHMETEATVLVSEFRYRNALRYLKSHPERMPGTQAYSQQKTVFILDDGFQHWEIKRNLDIVLVDAKDFHDELLPVGRLRERPSSLDRAGLVLERERDFQKLSHVQYRPQGQSLLVTTRAPDPGYIQFFRSLGIDVKPLVLGDHASPNALKKALHADSKIQDVLIGGKEAVKILSPLEYLELRRRGFFKWNLKSLHFVELRLKFQNEEKFWTQVTEKLRF